MKYTLTLKFNRLTVAKKEIEAKDERELEKIQDANKGKWWADRDRVMRKEVG